MANTFVEQTYVWFDGLNLDNSKSYFEAHRAEYKEFVAEPMQALMAELAAALDGSVKIFRPNRDIRFSADKSPYRPHAAGHVTVQDGGGHLYFHISPEGAFVATGIYEMGPQQLEAYRRALSEGPEAEVVGNRLTSILSKLTSHGFEIRGELLKTLPRGIAKDAPNQDLLKFKSLYTVFSIAPEDAIDANLTQTILDFWGKAAELRGWLNEFVGSGPQPPRR